MLRPWTLWLATVVLIFLLGFVFWVQFGYERTIVIYEEVEELTEEVRAPQVASAEEEAAAPIAQIPVWLASVQWSAIAVAAGLFVYIIYLELVYRRRRRG